MFGLLRLAPVTARRLILTQAIKPLKTNIRSTTSDHFARWRLEAVEPSGYWYYRQMNIKDHPMFVKVGSEFVMAFMWYWMMFHLWYDWDHIVGHFEYPDPSKWTDAELGIPPDDQD